MYYINVHVLYKIIHVFSNIKLYKKDAQTFDNSAKNIIKRQNNEQLYL